MIDELKKPVKYSFIASLIISFALLFVDYRYSLSVLVGNIVSFLYLYKLQNGITNLLYYQNSNQMRIFALFLTNLFVLGIPFYLAALFPNLFSFVFGALGLLLDKIVIYILTFTGRG